MDKEKEKRLLREKIEMTNDSIRKLLIANQDLNNELNELFAFVFSLSEELDKLDSK